MGTGSSGSEPACGDVDWLAGGTAAMAGDYPSPFVDEPAERCTLTSSQTCGPCYVAGPARKDVSDGEPGLPMRLNLRLVYEDTCEPVADATVDVWWTNVDGVYSGDTPAPSCANDDPDAPRRNWMRGQQTTDAAGEVEFDGCYPSWYPGRTPHIHVLVVLGGTAHYVTQLYFPDELSAGIFATHPDYNHRPEASTTNEQDGPYDAANPNLLQTRSTHDCAMQAWATIAVPAASAEVSC